jgi:choline dehydrogenase-like flavoprotein
MSSDRSLDASLGVLTTHHWADRPAGLGELRRVARRRVVLLTWDPDGSGDFWLTAEDLPSPENRVTLKNDGSIRVSYTRTNYAAYEMLKEKLKQVFVKLGEIDPDYKDTIWNGYDLDVSGVSHQNGTLRFGTDPKTSVLDINCKAHDLENLYVADASFFPSCGAFNPALTIAANALRVGDHLIKKVFRSSSMRRRFEAAVLF